MKHRLKIGDERLANIKAGKKRVEIRLNDRDYQVGDILEFHDIVKSTLHNVVYVRVEVTHIHSGLGMEQNYVALSIKEAPDE